MFQEAYFKTFSVESDLDDEVCRACDTGHISGQSELSLRLWIVLDNAGDDQNCNSIALKSQSCFEYMPVTYCFYGRGEKI